MFRRLPEDYGNLSVVSKTPLLGVTCFGSEMTVAISCFLYYFVLLANLSKNEVPNSQFTMHNSQWKSSLKRAVQSEREIQPLKTGVSLSRLRVQRYDDFSDSANVSETFLKTFSLALTYVKTLAREHIIIYREKWQKCFFVKTCFYGRQTLPLQQ